MEKYVMRLTAEERAELEAMTRQRGIAVDKQLRAKLLHVMKASIDYVVPGNCWLHHSNVIPLTTRTQ